MKKSLPSLALAAICSGLLSLAGCSGQGSLAYTFAKGSFEAKGASITIALAGNPTTGFEWTSSLDGSSLKQTSSTYVPDSKDKNLCGGGGVYYFVYEGVDAGTATIAFTYARPWEEDGMSTLINIAIETDEKGSVISSKATSDQGELLGCCSTSYDQEYAFSSLELSDVGCSAIYDKYVAQRTSTGVTISHYQVTMGPEDEVVLVSKKKGDEALYAQIVSTLKEARIKKWDGFSGSDPRILDGSSFSFKCTLQDGSTISASGTNKYPSNYGSVYRAIVDNCA